LSIFSIFRHETRLGEVEDKTRELERAFAALELEWNNVFDNVRRLAAKIAKREQRAPETPKSDHGGDLFESGATPDGLDMNERIRLSRRAPK
jgi:hypothetical protein